LTKAIDLAPYLMRKSLTEAIDDRRFAEAVYRTAVVEGIVARTRYQDVPDGPT
jgi:hypothetical protein